MSAEGGQFTVRGLFVLVAACAVMAAILRFTSFSVTSLVTGFAVGWIVAMSFVAVAATLDAIERRAQCRLAESLNSAETATPTGPFSAA